MKFLALCTLAFFSSLDGFAAEEIIPQPALRSWNREGVTIHAVTFDSRSHQLRVLDQPKGPGSTWLSAQEACQSVNGLAALNAGYFTPQGKPLGVVMSDGVKRGSSHGSSLGSGLWFEHQGHTAISRRERWPARAQQLIQAGPMLIEHAKSVTGLDATKTSARSFIAWNGRYSWMMARTSPCSLAKLSQLLTALPLGEGNIQSALNLDGGTSSDLYAGPKVIHGPTVQRAIWNKPVRNFLVLQKR